MFILLIMWIAAITEFSPSALSFSYKVSDNSPSLMNF